MTIPIIAGLTAGSGGSAIPTIIGNSSAKMKITITVIRNSGAIGTPGSSSPICECICENTENGRGKVENGVIFP